MYDALLRNEQRSHYHFTSAASFRTSRVAQSLRRVGRGAGGCSVSINQEGVEKNKETLSGGLRCQSPRWDAGRGNPVRRSDQGVEEL